MTGTFTRSNETQDRTKQRCAGARAVQGVVAAPRVLGESARRHGRFDLPGAITGTGGLAAMVYGLSNAATTPDGVSHWGDAKVVASLTAAVVLLAAFMVTELRSRNVYAGA